MPKASELVVREVDSGISLPIWEEFSQRMDYMDVLGEVKFTFAGNRQILLARKAAFEKGRLIQLKIDGHPQGMFFVETVETRVSPQRGFTVTFRCRSPLVVATEANVDPGIVQSFSADTPVQDAILKAMAPFGFDKIAANMIENLSILTGKAVKGTQAKEIKVDELKHQDIQANPGESAYDFCRKIFTRLGVILTLRHDGVLLVQQPDYDQEPSGYLTDGEQKNAIANRMLEYTITDTNAGQFSEIVVVGKSANKRGATTAGTPTFGLRIEGAGEPSPNPYPKVQFEEVKRGYHHYKSTQYPYKPLYMEDKEARDVERTKNMAYAQLAVDSANAWQLVCVVEGLKSRLGAIWTPGTMVHVVDMDESLFVKAVERSVNAGGQRTTLTLIPRDSIILKVG